MTPEQLYRYADRYARRREARGEGTQYPTFRQVARRFSVSYDAIEQACGDYQGDGYMGMASYFVTPPEPRSAFVVEAYGDTPTPPTTGQGGR